MNLKKTLLSVFFLATLSSTVWAVEADKASDVTTTVQGTNDDYITHTVETGDTVYSLARKYNTTTEEIYRLNPDAKNGIKNGQILRLPKAQEKKSGNNTSVDKSSYAEHVVAKGETLYGISKAEEVSVSSLIDLNPELKSGLREGMKLRIPRKKIPSTKDVTVKKVTSSANAEQPSYIEHKVQKGETLYKLSKAYNISVDAILASNPNLTADGLKTGKKVRIPKMNLHAPTTATEEGDSKTRSINANEPVRIGILFPFLDDKASVQKEKLVEYYEGFLLAMKNLKESGVNAEIYTFDTGAEKDIKRLRNILETSEVNNLHMVIGGTSQDQINLMTDFSQKTGIKYVIPFGVKKSQMKNSPNVFQITTSHTLLYPNVTKAFINKYRNTNIIFISELGSDNNKSSFTTALKKALTEENVPFKDLTPGDKIVDNMKVAVSTSQENVIIPTSSSEISLRKIAGVLDLVPSETITLFGYPEWQTYLHLNSQIFKYNTCIYSSFYLDESNEKVRSAMTEYREWYNKAIALSFPKFAFLGYDTGLYFVSGINKYKNRFTAELPFIKSPTMQTAVHFTQENETSGYLNTGFYFIHFKKDSTIEKIEYK